MSELYEDELLSGMITLYNRVAGTLDFIYESTNKCSVFNDYDSPKLKGFTQVKGRKKLSKKKRKQLKPKQ